MIKSIITLAALGVVGVAHGSFTISFDEPFKSVSAPNSGSLTVSFTGKVHVLFDEFEITDVHAELPAQTPTGPYVLSGLIPDAFSGYVFESHPGEDFTGVLVEIYIPAGTPDGNYWFNGLFGSDDSELKLTGSGPNGEISKFAPYGVSIVSQVPEPATLLALCVGAGALLRRKRIS